jgi:hypothetical protein
MPQLKLGILLLGLPVVSLMGMEKPRSAKRRLFEQEIPTTPTKKVAENVSVPDTRHATPGTPYIERKKKLTAQGIIPLAVQNMSEKPVIVAYHTPKGPTHRLLTASKENFVESRLDDEVSFKHGFLTLMPTGEHFQRLALEKGNKLKIEQYMETAHGNGFVTIGDVSIDDAKPLLIQLQTRKDDKGFKRTDIDILNK